MRVTRLAARRMIAGMNFWLVKSEPAAYAWANLVKDRRTAWTGVRNFQARNNLRAMKRDELVCFYHSVSEKHIVGLARVTREAYPDPTATEGDWSCVELAPVKPLAKPVTLETIKADKMLKDLPLVRQSRLSVTPLSKAQFQHLLALAETKVQTVFLGARREGQLLGVLGLVGSAVASNGIF